MQASKSVLWLMCFWAFAVGALQAQQNYTVYLASGAMTPPANFTPNLKALPTVQPVEVHQNRYRRLVQFQQIPDKRMQSLLSDAGLQMEGYVDFGAYLVSVPVGFDWKTVQTLAQIRSVVAMAPEWKVSPKVFEQPYAAWAFDGAQVACIVSFQSGVKAELGAALLRREGLIFKQTLPDPALAYVKLAPSDVLRIAALPFVSYIELVPAPGETEDDKGKALHRSNLVESESSIGPKYNGAGIGVLVRDDGAVGPHLDFHGRITNVATEFGANHGDGVAGIMTGAANLDPDKRGMAAGADLYVVDYVNSFQDQTLPLHLNSGVKVTNSSYSDGCNAGYTAATVTVDKQLFENTTLMHVFSAGNSNGSSCNYGAGTQWGNITGGHKQSKNSIASANLNQVGALDGTSSRGPAYDGRLKPDISANGTNHLSNDENNLYQTFGGTSGAAPGVAGCMAQLLEAYKSLNNGTEAPTALIKAVMLNTTNDLGNAGPDYRFGWGLVHGGRALKVLNAKTYAQNSVAQGEEKTFDIQLPAGASDLRVMVYWPERQAAQNAAKALINDLDISVAGPDQLINFPWKLDPTANATTLALPAGRGRDSLNNMEQVYYQNPQQGSYRLTVKGTAVPFGSTDYYIVYDYTTERLKLTYPNGGEAYAPGKSVNINWDAEPGTEAFALKYTIDGGANWVNIAAPAATARVFTWSVPIGLKTGKMLVSIERGTERDQSDTTFAVMPLVTGLTVEKVCPDSVTVAWSALADAEGYEVFLLGQKYMEVVGSSTQTSLTFPKVVSSDPMWLSIRPIVQGAPGRRINAIQRSGQLANCPQQVDYGLTEFIQPAGGGVFACDSSSKNVQIRVNNAGLSSITNLSVSYRINQNAPVTEFIQEVLPNATYEHTFNTALNFNGNGTYKLQVWVSAPGDLVSFNDTLTESLVVVTQAQTGYFTQNFEGANFPPDGYRIENPDDLFTCNGNNTSAIWMHHFDYEERDALDNFYVIPVDLTGLNKATLSFDLAHAGFDATYFDGLRVSVYTGCSLSGSPEVVFEKIGEPLATTLNQTSEFTPDDASDWRRESINLDSYIGEKVILMFTAINDFGNNTYIDNINLSDAVISIPVANILATKDTICRLDTIMFNAPGDASLGYTWSFGAGAQPSATANGQGPHSRTYLSAGAKAVRLVVSGPGGSDTATQNIIVQALPNVAFTNTTNNSTVTFVTTGTATDYLWDFGDGTTSIEKNPVHVYANAGSYSVTLVAGNKCQTDTKTATVVITSSLNETLENAGIKLLPNPNAGSWIVDITRETRSALTLQLFDASGRLLHTVQANHTGGNQSIRIPFEQTGLPAGHYVLEVQSERETVRGVIVVSN
jgi:PKD repeat protein